MDEIRGLTEIDSHFEYVGFRFAGLLHGFFSDSYFYVIAALSAVAYLVYQALQKESFKAVFVYFFYLFAMCFLIGPVRIKSHVADYHWDTSTDYTFFQDNYTTAKEITISVPRFLMLVNGLADKVARAGVSDDVQRKITMEIDADRIAGYFNEYRITDEVLKEQVHGFLKHCWKPVVALMHKKQAEPKYIQAYLEHPHWIHLEGETEREALGHWVKYCKETKEEIQAGLVSAIRDTIKPSVKDAHGKVRDEDWDYYASLLVRKEMVAQYSDAQLAKRGLERYGHETYWSSHDSISRGSFFGVLLHGALTMYTNVKQAISNEVTSRAARYQVITLAPYFYGFSLMLVLCFFPIAALYALIPGKWIALVNFSKILFSIKLWPVFWNILYLFEEQSRDTGVILAIPFVYIGIPALCFALVNLISSATNAAIGTFTGGLAPVKASPVRDAVKVVTLVAGGGKS